MPIKLKIRNYLTTDKESCLRIFDSNVPKFFLAHERKDFEEFLTKFSQFYFVAELKNEIVACGGLGFKNKGEARFCWGIVHSKNHRKGIGQALLLYRLKRASQIPEIKSVTLDTIQHNPKFFEKFGFVTEKVTENYYGPNMHSYEMRLILTDATRKRLSNLESLSVPPDGSFRFVIRRKKRRGS